MPKGQRSMPLQGGGASWIPKIYALFNWIDGRRLWWVGIVLLAIVMVPHVRLGEGSVFIVHDQLDECLMHYVLTARHPGVQIIPEMMGGINASGLQPPTILFMPLFRVLPAFYAFLLCYVIVFFSSFLGMYLAVKEMTDSSILAVVLGGCFCMLTEYPIYGLSTMGLPLLLYAVLCLSKGKRVKTALVLTIFFGLTGHLVYTGYGALGFWAIAILGGLICKKRVRYSVVGFGALLTTYLVTNYQLFLELLLGQPSR